MAGALEEKGRNRHSWAGPFGMGGQGWLVVAVVIVVTALFAATRPDWPSLVACAVLPPVVIFPLIFLVSRHWEGGRTTHGRRRAGEGIDPITFLALTNPVVFLLFVMLSRGSHEERHQQLLRLGPFGLGEHGYRAALIMMLVLGLGPLILALIVMAAGGRLPG